MPKENSNYPLSIFARMNQFLKNGQYAKTSMIIMGIVLFFFILLMYSNPSSNSKSTLQSEMQTTLNLNLKVLPPTLSEIESANLDKSSFNYVAMIDAGSSGCRAHVYKYGRLGSADGPVYVLIPHESKKVKPGLSSFADNPSAAGASLKGLIDFMKEQVPEELWATTPIWLKATAGLRLLPADVSDSILKSVRQFLSNSFHSPFYFKSSHAKLISGSEEGAFGWIAYNYMRKILGPIRSSKNDTPYGVIEMGGASTQVSQLIPDAVDAVAIPEEYKFTFTLNKESYTIYTHSYLGFGLEQARERLNALLIEKVTEDGTINDPCLNVGYVREKSAKRATAYDGPDGEYRVVGDASDDSCQDLIKHIFPRNENCPYGSDSTYSFGCVFQPYFVKATHALIFENFYYIASGLQVPISSYTVKDSTGPLLFPIITTPDKYESTGKIVCSASWSELQSSYPKDTQSKDNNVKWCFGISFAEMFLTQGLGFEHKKMLTVAKEVDGVEIEWALGAAYKEILEFVSKSS